MLFRSRRNAGRPLENFKKLWNLASLRTVVEGIGVLLSSSGSSSTNTRCHTKRGELQTITLASRMRPKICHSYTVEMVMQMLACSVAKCRLMRRRPSTKAPAPHRSTRPRVPCFSAPRSAPSSTSSAATCSARPTRPTPSCWRRCPAERGRGRVSTLVRRHNRSTSEREESLEMMRAQTYVREVHCADNGLECDPS